MPSQIKIWKTCPTYYFLLETLKKKGDLPETELLNSIQSEFGDIGYNDFNNLLLKLEVAGKIRTTSMARGKKRIELVQ